MHKLEDIAKHKEYYIQCLQIHLDFHDLTSSLNHHFLLSLQIIALVVHEATNLLPNFVSSISKKVKNLEHQNLNQMFYSMISSDHLTFDLDPANSAFI